MSRFGKYFNSTIGRKQVMGLTGLGLSLFVLTHMLGNLLMFVGPDAYNMYGHKLTSNPAIYLAEAGLLFFFFALAAVSDRILMKTQMTTNRRHCNFITLTSPEQ